MHVNDVKENASALDSGRLSLNELKSSKASGIRKSTAGLAASSIQKLNVQAPGEDRRFQKTLQEKDRQISALQKQLLLANDRAHDLLAESEKIKRQEREAKRLLSSKETSAKRQMILLKQAEDRLNCISGRDERRAKRSLLERKELEKQFEDLEIEYEEYIEFVQGEKEKDKLELETLSSKHEEEIRELRAKLEQDVSLARDEQADELHHVQDQLEEYRTLNEELSINVTSLNENLRKLSEENDEIRGSLDEKTAASDRMQSLLEEKESMLTSLQQEVASRIEVIAELKKTISEMTRAFEEGNQSHDKDQAKYEHEIKVRDETVKAIKADLEDSVSRLKLLEEKYQSNLVVINNMKNNLAQYESQDEENRHKIASLESSLSSAESAYQRQIGELTDLSKSQTEYMSAMNLEMEELKTANQTLNAVIAELQETKGAIESTMTSEVKNSQLQIVQLRADLSEKSSHCDKVEAEAAAMKTSLADLMMQLERSQLSILDLEQSKKMIATEHHELEVELQNMLEDLRRQREEFSAKLTLMNEVRDQQQNEENLRQQRVFEKQLQAKESAIVELRKIYDEECANKAMLVDRIAAVEQDYQDVVNEVSVLSKKLEAEKDHYDAVIHTNEGVVSNLHATIIELRSDLMHSSEAIVELKNAIDQKNQELDTARNNAILQQQQYNASESMAAQQIEEMKEQLHQSTHTKEEIVASLKIAIDTLKGQLEEKIQHVHALESEQSNMMAEALLLKHQMEDMKDGFNRLSLDSKNEMAVAEAEHMKAMLALKGDNAKLETEVASMQDQLSSVKAMKADLESELVMLNRKLTILEESSAESMKDTVTKFKVIDEAKEKSMAELRQFNAMLESHLVEERSNVKSLQDSLRLAQEDVSSLTIKIKEQEAANRQMVNELKSAYDAADTTKDKQLAELIRERDIIRSSVDEKVSKINDLNQKISALQSEVDSAKAMMAEMEIKNTKTVEDLTQLHETCEQAKDNMIKSLRQQLDDGVHTMNMIKHKLQSQDDANTRALELSKSKYESSLAMKETTIKELRDQQVEMLQAIAVVKAKALSHEDATNKTMEAMVGQHELEIKAKDALIVELREQYDAMLQDAAEKVDQSFSSDTRIQALEKELAQSVRIWYYLSCYYSILQLMLS
jgi:chromosome segregation ATPase